MSALAIAALVAGALMGVCWLVSLIKRDASIVDPLWPMVFVAIAWSVWLAGDGAGSGRDALMLAMVSAWGLRLGAHLTVRKWGEPEDFRYQAMRRRLRPFWLWSILVVFVLQGVLAVVVALPVQAVLGDPGPSPLGWLDWMGAAVWFGAGGASRAGDFGRGRVVRSDAEVEMPLLEVHGEVAVQVADAGLARRLDLPDGAGDQQADADALPFRQAVVEDAEKSILVGGYRK